MSRRSTGTGLLLLSIVIVIAAELVAAIFAGPFGATIILVTGVFLWVPAATFLIGASRIWRTSRSFGKTILLTVLCWATALIVGGVLLATVDLLSTGNSSFWSAAATWISLQGPFALLGVLATTACLIPLERTDRRKTAEAD